MILSVDLYPAKFDNTFAACLFYIIDRHGRAFYEIPSFLYAWLLYDGYLPAICSPV